MLKRGDVMTDIERLILIRIRNVLKSLQRAGVGKIEDRVDNKIFYRVDDTVIEITVKTEEI